MMKLKISFCLVICLITYSLEQQNCSCLFSNGCHFNGVTYLEGEQLPGVCFILTCIKGISQYEWQTGNSIDLSCAGCYAVDDPHMKTFDGHNYDWHGTCNYSISQRLECPGSYNPAYGIFGDFVPCGKASCVDITTYKVNQNTVATIYHSNPTKLDVNGYPVPLTTTPQLIRGLPLPNDVHPLLAWRVTLTHWWKPLNVLNCVVLQGIDFSVRACDNSLYISTTVDHKYHLHGLCGYYSGNPTDDYMGRDCLTLSLLTTTNINLFAISWLTLQQSDIKCIPDNVIEQVAGIPAQVNCSNETNTTFTNFCENAIEGFPRSATRARLIADCLNDCCRNPDDCKTIWIPNEQDLAMQAIAFGMVG